MLGGEWRGEIGGKNGVMPRGTSRTISKDERICNVGRITQVVVQEILEEGVRGVTGECVVRKEIQD